MKIAFFTPLTPLKSGVADFSEELLLGMKQYTDLDIDIFIGDYKPSNKEIISNFTIKKFKEFEDENVRSEYDEVIYQIGNNEQCHEEIYNMALKYPGIIELHDIALHHFIAATTLARGNVDEYKRIMRYCHGVGGEKVVDRFLNQEILPPWETDALTFTVNKEIVDAAKAIIVHSDFAKQIIKGIRPDVPVQLIYLHTPDIYEDYEEQKKSSREELNIGQDEFIISSFGFATKTKRIKEIMQALAQVKKQGYIFKYYIAGQADENLQLDRVIKELGLENEVIITGFLELGHMKKLMLASDVCMALRYPSQGESSGVLHRMFGMGKVIMVTNVTNFSEYPDDVVIKIEVEKEVDNISKNIIQLINKPEKRDSLKKEAFKFSMDKCSLKINTMMYKNSIIHSEYTIDLKVEDIILSKIEQLQINDFDILSRMLRILEY